MTHKKLCIFDLDGTLVDAYTAIAQSLNKTRAAFGYRAVSYRRAKAQVGRGERQFIETFFPAHETDAALRQYRRHHARDIHRCGKALPGARQLLSYLRSRGIRIAVASNRPDAFTRLLLRVTKLSRYIGTVLCADTIGAYKPNPALLHVLRKKYSVSPAQTVYCGDMAVDALAAKRARIDFIFVRGGSDTLKNVSAYPIKKTVTSLAHLLRYIKTA